ncbi:unnamed protein product [Prunus armeniaca]|uniref:Uncharacterized protein n=1 Tax=Prunus armeniaca TaxID=36596 RepID=A0A6J5UYV5_PRUAR|nr:unnamed protein product [Prunus armeniaca]
MSSYVPLRINALNSLDIACHQRGYLMAWETHVGSTEERMGCLVAVIAYLGLGNHGMIGEHKGYGGLGGCGSEDGKVTTVL